MSSADPSAREALSVLKATASFSVETDQSKLLKRLMRIVLETAGATRGALVLQNSNKEWCVELGGSVELEEAEACMSNCPDRTQAPVEPARSAITDALLRAASGDSAGGDKSIPSSNASESSHSSVSSSSSGDSEGNSGIRFGTSHRAGVVSVESALPASIFHYVLGSAETLLLSDPHNQTDGAYSAFGADPYFETHHPRAVLCMPVLRAGAVFGVLYLENDYRSVAFTSAHIQLLQLLCSQAALSIDNARLYSALSENNASLELQVRTRTAELEEKNRQLSAAKEAAEKATKIKSDFLSNMSAPQQKNTLTPLA
jgi:GAF domain-containing protein